MFKVPTIEEIYNEYHKQTFYIRNGVYPKTLKNFDSIYSDPTKLQFLKSFVAFLERNKSSVDWKLYILALAKVLRTRYDLQYLGSFKGNKIYRDYVKSLQGPKDGIEDIYSTIINSLTFLQAYIKESEISFMEYFDCGNKIIPDALNHIYAGTVSPYLWACFPHQTLAKWFNYPDDVFYELFHVSKYEFLQTWIINKREQILSIKKIQELICLLEQKFSKYL
jgi:hypothetical protein